MTATPGRRASSGASGCSPATSTSRSTRACAAARTAPSFRSRQRRARCATTPAGSSGLSARCATSPSAAAPRHSSHTSPITIRSPGSSTAAVSRRSWPASQHARVSGVSEAALVMLDLDNFKYVNETYGHKSGDELVSSIAASLQGELGPVDVLARFGGDEFGVLIIDTDGERARELGERAARRRPRPRDDDQRDRDPGHREHRRRRLRRYPCERRGRARGRRPRDVPEQGEGPQPRDRAAALRSWLGPRSAQPLDRARDPRRARPRPLRALRAADRQPLERADDPLRGAAAAARRRQDHRPRPLPACSRAPWADPPDRPLGDRPRVCAGVRAPRPHGRAQPLGRDDRRSQPGHLRRREAQTARHRPSPDRLRADRNLGRRQHRQGTGDGAQPRPSSAASSRSTTSAPASAPSTTSSTSRPSTSRSTASSCRRSAIAPTIS